MGCGSNPGNCPSLSCPGLHAGHHTPFPSPLRHTTPLSHPSLHPLHHPVSPKAGRLEDTWAGVRTPETAHALPFPCPALPCMRDVMPPPLPLYVIPTPFPIPPSLHSINQCPQSGTSHKLGFEPRKLPMPCTFRVLPCPACGTSCPLPFPIPPSLHSINQCPQRLEEDSGQPVSHRSSLLFSSLSAFASPSPPRVLPVNSYGTGRRYQALWSTLCADMQNKQEKYGPTWPAALSRTPLLHHHRPPLPPSSSPSSPHPPPTPPTTLASPSLRD